MLWVESEVWNIKSPSWTAGDALRALKRNPNMRVRRALFLKFPMAFKNCLKLYIYYEIYSYFVNDMRNECLIAHVG